MVVVKVKENVYTLVENSTALEFIEKLNNSPEEEFSVDFSGIRFVSRSFAQGYFSSKINSDKKIFEINVDEGVQPLFDMMENRFKID